MAFVVFAPNARRVSVVGDFNLWDGRRHAMRVRGNGYWEIFVPGARAGDKYKYEIIGPDGAAAAAQGRPGGVRRRAAALDRLDRGRCRRGCRGRCRLEHDANALDAPMSIYEVHLGSWRRKPEEGNRWLTYRELAEQLPAYAADMGFTHIELLPVSRASVRRLVGLSADRAVRADQPVRHAGGFRRADRRLPPRRASACCSTGCRGISPTTRTGSATSTAPRSTSTPTRCRAAISTGAR